MRSAGLVGLVALGLVACSSDPGSNGNEARPRRVITADWLNRSLSVLDYDKLVAGATTRDEALTDTLDLSAYQGPGPIEIATTPNGSTAVVTQGPGFFAGTLATLFGLGAIETTGTALIVELDGLVVTETRPPTAAMGVAITPDGKRAITADHEGDTLSVIDLEQKTLVESVVVGGSPEEVAINEDGTWGVINDDASGSIAFFDPRNPSTTLTPKVFIDDDPGGSGWVSGMDRVVVGKSLPRTGPGPGFSVVDATSPGIASVIDAQPLPGVSYGADPIPGTTHVLITAGLVADVRCALYEIDAAPRPAILVRTIPLPCDPAGNPGLPMSTAIDPEGKHAFVGIVGDNSLMVVDLEAGTARRIPWLAQPGPTDVVIAL